MNDQIINISGIAETLQCSVGTAEKLVKSGQIRATKQTGKWLTLQSEVIDYTRRQITGKKPC